MLSREREKDRVHSLLASMRTRFRGTPQLVERRGFKRVAAALDAEVVALGGAELTRPINGVIEDLSAGGMRLRTEWPFEPGASLRVRFSFGGDNHSDVAEVVVVACEPSAPNGFAVHCRMDELPRKTWWRFVDWMLSRGP
jgi:hypothetical protein